MKKYMLMMALVAIAAGTAFAEEGEDGSQHQKGKFWGKPSRDQTDDRGGPDRGDRMDKRGGKDHPGGPMDPAMMEQMKADHKEIKALGEAARAVTNEAAKAEIVAQLRAKLGEVADRMQVMQEKRLAQAEEHLVALKAKIEDSKANRDKLIEEQVQRVLSGERPQHPDRFKDFPNAKHGMPEGGPEGGMPPPPPPPPGEEMPDGMPPPPAE